LEDWLFPFLPRNVLNLTSTIRFFEVVDRRFYVKDGEVLQQFTNDGSRGHIVAISQDGTRVYRLFGFPGAESAYNQLAHDFHIVIQDEEKAEQYGRLCAEVVYGVLPPLWIQGSGDAELAAANYFGVQKAVRWWSKYRSKYSEANLKSSARIMSKDVFQFRLPILHGSPSPLHQEEPKIEDFLLQIHKDGRVSQP